MKTVIKSSPELTPSTTAPGSSVVQIRIETANESDVSVTLELVRELAAHENLLNSMTATEDSLRDALFSAQPSAEVLLARHGIETIGMAIFFMTFSSMRGRRCLYLDDLYVKEKWRGKGIGRQLLTRVTEVAAARNCARVEWVVHNWNHPAIRLYESCGATLLREWTRCRMEEHAIQSLSGTCGY